MSGDEHLITNSVRAEVGCIGAEYEVRVGVQRSLKGELSCQSIGGIVSAHAHHFSASS